MPADISEILGEWPFEPGRINARIIEGNDGRKKLQVRMQLGLLQLELEGRPDGARPHGCESLLEYHKSRSEQYLKGSGGAAGFILAPEDCRALRDEAAMYHHRYVGLFAVQDYEGVVRDTNRTLELLELLQDFAAEESDRISMEQFRPHLIMMRARAEAARAIGGKDGRTALRILDRAIAEIRQALASAGLAQDVEHSNELALLIGMRDALVPRLPASQRVELEERLASAIAAENFELAAILRDELRMLRE